jgi:hypothetical protein
MKHAEIRLDFGQLICVNENRIRTVPKEPLADDEIKDIIFLCGMVDSSPPIYVHKNVSRILTMPRASKSKQLAAEILLLFDYLVDPTTIQPPVRGCLR